MKDYDLLREKIKAIPHTLSETIVHILLSALLSLLIVVGPVAILLNCLIFIDAVLWIYLGLGVCFFVFFFLTRCFYFQSFVKGSFSLKGLYGMEVIYALVVTLVLMVILLFG